MVCVVLSHHNFVCLFVRWQLFKIPLSHIMNGFAPLNLSQLCHLPLLFPPLPFTFYHLNAFILAHCFNYHLCLKNKEKVNQAAAFDLILLVFVSPGWVSSHPALCCWPFSINLPCTQTLACLGQHRCSPRHSHVYLRFQLWQDPFIESMYFKALSNLFWHVWNILLNLTTHCVEKISHNSSYLIPWLPQLLIFWPWLLQLFSFVHLCSAKNAAWLIFLTLLTHFKSFHRLPFTFHVLSGILVSI